MSKVTDAMIDTAMHAWTTSGSGPMREVWRKTLEAAEAVREPDPEIARLRAELAETELEAEKFCDRLVATLAELATLTAAAQAVAYEYEENRSAVSYAIAALRTVLANLGKAMS